MSGLDRLRRIVGALWPWGRWIAIRCEELPEAPRSRRIYLVGDDEPWSAGFLCPCGCGALIQLSLVSRDRPSWRATIGAGSVISLHPSVWRQRGCRSHFFIREGRVAWAPSDPMPGFDPP